MNCSVVLAYCSSRTLLSGNPILLKLSQFILSNLKSIRISEQLDPSPDLHRISSASALASTWGLGLSSASTNSFPNLKHNGDDAMMAVEPAFSWHDEDGIATFAFHDLDYVPHGTGGILAPYIETTPGTMRAAAALMALNPLPVSKLPAVQEESTKIVVCDLGCGDGDFRKLVLLPF